MRSPLLKILRRLRSEQRGQSLIVVSLAMVVVLGVSAMAIDVGTWYVKHHQDQVIADSAALAAANCLAHPNTGPNTSTMPQCTSGTDTTDAETVAVAYAARNGLPASDLQVNITNNQVTVKAKTSNTPAFFANMFGINTTTQSAHAVAGWTSVQSTTCTTADENAGECYAIYAQNAACGSNDGWVTNETSERINGAVHSQGALNISDGSFTFTGPITYSSGNCTYTQAGNLSMSSGTGYYTPAAGDNQTSSFWPINYATDFPACGSASSVSCVTVNGVSGVPSYCTDVSTSASGFTFSSNNGNPEIPYSGHVYCSIGQGTGVNNSNPATWNGPITFSNGANTGSSSNPVDATFIGGYVNATSSTLYLAPELDNCLIYALDTDSASGGDAISFPNGTYNFTGTMFAPNGTINLTETSATAAFLEAQNVDTVNLSYTGDGPLATGSSSSSTGTDSLTQ
jgi:hypothetical protein